MKLNINNIQHRFQDGVRANPVAFAAMSEAMTENKLPMEIALKHCIGCLIEHIRTLPPQADGGQEER